MRIVKELKFCKVKNERRRQKKTLTPSDKTSNMYRLNENDYHNLLRNAIKTTNKKANKDNWPNINKEDVKFAKQAGILDKTDMNCARNSFVTLKDHKENFKNHPTTRLLNPSKNEIGTVSKHILDQINTKLVSKLSVNEWKSTKV